MLPIARGNSVATALNISRKSFRGDLELLAQNLPAGVTMEAPAVHESFTSTPILFGPHPMRSLANSLVDLRLKHENKEKNQLVEGSFAHSVSLVYGAPNNRTYYETKVNRLAVGVVDSLPFKVKLHQPIPHCQERLAKPEG